MNNSPKAAPQKGSGWSALFSHPKGLYVLSVTEMWERMSFYGMRGLLMFFFMAALVKGGWNLAEGEARLIVGLYGGLLYLACLPSGLIADRYLGIKNAVLLGAVFQGIGHLLLAFGSVASFIGGCWLLILGTGLLKTNVSSLVGLLYKKGDTARASGVTFFYQWVNVGAVCGGFVSAFGEVWGFSYGFGAAGLGMLISIAVFLGGSAYVPSDKRASSQTRFAALGTVILALAGVVLIFGLSSVVARATALKIAATGGDLCMIGLGGLILGILGYVYANVEGKVERERLVVFSLVLFGLIAYASIFDQAFGLFMSVAQEKVERSVNWSWIGVKFEIPATLLNMLLNPIFVVLLGAPMNFIWRRLQRSYPRFPSTTKIGIGLLILALSCVVFMKAVALSEYGKISPMWMVIVHFAATVAELCITVVGITFATEVAPTQYKATLMGLVWGSLSLGVMLSGRIGKLATPEELGINYVFGAAAISLAVLGLGYILLNNVLHRMTHGAESKST